MGRRYVLFDVNYLSYRAFFSTGALSHHGEATGVLYGVFKEIQAARRRFAGHRFVFCFDHGKGLREQMYPGYKATRRAKRVDDQQAEQIEAMLSQVNLMRTKLLGRCGYNNVFYQTGYEADDVIASVVKNLRPKDGAVVYSDDKDLYQLLGPNVSMWKPRTGVMYYEQDFAKEFGIPPKKWALVKAIAGCISDDVVGVKGVGEKTAVDYIDGLLSLGHAKYKAIRAARDQWKKNLPIVRLPLEGCKTFELCEDELMDGKWDDVVGQFGMASLTDGMPGGLDRKPLLKV